MSHLRQHQEAQYNLDKVNLGPAFLFAELHGSGKEGSCHSPGRARHEMGKSLLSVQH